jgi:hypothetical protein
MALTEFQKRVCRLIARHRIASGESYVAGGSALNELIAAPRISRDIDLFHDSEAALSETWDKDRKLLEREFQIAVLRERPSFVEAKVFDAGDSVLLQWATDSVYRFFPLVEHEELGLVLHPFDLATNKVLALVGRLEVRDWIDVIACDESVQPLGYLAWAACGKDPGFSPAAILEEAGRSSHYSALEISELSFASAPPDAASLSQRWHAMLASARSVVAALPPQEAGKCVIGHDGRLFQAELGDLRAALDGDRVRFHSGSIRGALPRVLGGGQ